MTVSAPATNLVSHLGNGVTTVFPYTFLIPEDTHVVTITDLTTGLEGDALNTALYTITGEDDPAGGNVTYPLTGSPLSSSYRLNIRRIVEIEQTLNIDVQSAFFPTVLEDQLDKIVMILGQHEEQLNRALLIGEGSTTADVADLIAAIEAAVLAVEAVVGDYAEVTQVNVFADGQIFRSSDAGAAAGPSVILDRASASPAASDVLGDLIFRGKDSGANDTNYADILTRILDPTNGSEDGALALRVMIAGALTEMLTLGNSEGGVVELPRGRLKFPAAQVASSDANTLDDYEEGTWTPGVAFGGASVGVTYGSQTGRYIKIGRLVFASFSIGLTSNGSSTGNFQITGLPFTTDTAPSGAGVIETYNNFATVAREMILDVSPSDTILQFREGTAASAASNITEADVTDTAVITAHVFYLVP